MPVVAFLVAVAHCMPVTEGHPLHIPAEVHRSGVVRESPSVQLVPMAARVIAHCVELLHATDTHCKLGGSVGQLQETPLHLPL